MAFLGTITEHTVTYWAALYESTQAEADYVAAHRIMRWSGARAGSPEDYAVWSASGYADASERVLKDLPVWED